MHVKCNGLNRASDHDENFGCIRCTSLITDNTTTDIQAPPTQLQQAPSTNYKNLANASSNETITATPDPWSNPTPEKNYKIKTIYSQVVHQKTVFMILAKNRIGFNFIETLKRTLNSLTETQENTLKTPRELSHSRKTSEFKLLSKSSSRKTLPRSQ